MASEDRKQLITISGNIGVGKTTYGEHLARFYNAVWLPETNISSQFQYLVAHECRSSRLIAQLAFASMRVATIRSELLNPQSTIVVVERSLRDSIIFHRVWEHLFDLKEYHKFSNTFYSLLGSDIGVPYDEHIIWMRCTVPTIQSRLSKRGLTAESAHTKEVLTLLDAEYCHMFRRKLPAIHAQYTVNTDDRNLSLLSMDAFTSEIEGAFQLKRGMDR